MKKKFAIIDANAVIHRGFHALPPLMTKDGVLVNAVYGFANILLKVLKDIKPDYVAVCFDVARKTFRNEMYKEYKAHRESGPQELYDQIKMTKELVKAFKMPIYAQKGYEADDLIGTLVTKTQKHKNTKTQIENYIVTGDLDTLQLVNENTKVYTLKRGVADTFIYDTDAVKQRYGFSPQQVVDYKALRGDPSDNIPGIKGIGEKTATELIKEFGGLRELYKFLDSLKKLDEETRNQSPNKQTGKFTGGDGGSLIEGKLETQGIKKAVYEKLVKYKKDAFLSKKLATIKEDVKIKFDLEEAKVEPFDAQRVAQLFQEWNFKSLIARIPAAEKVITKGQKSLFDPAYAKASAGKADKFEIRKGYHLVGNQKELDEFIKKLKSQKEFALDTETDGLNPFESNLIGMSFCWQAGNAYYVLTNNNLDELKKILSNEKIKKIGHNIKFDLEVLNRAGFGLNGIEFDSMIASYLLNPGSRQHKLDTIVFTELGYEMTPIESLIGPSRRAEAGRAKDEISMAQVDIQRVVDYACEDADYTWRLYQKLEKQLVKNDLLDLMNKIENPLISVLANMEKNGVMVDVKFLNKMSHELELRIKNYELRIFKLAGTKFNVRSPMQLKEVLFEKMKISTAGLSKTKTGISTAAAELDKLQGVHPIIDLIMDHRELSKLKSTYTDALPELINPQTKRIHTSFNQTVTATGRLSSSDPNLQNIPIRTELGKKIRKAFVVPKGYKILAADYSQIELRIAAVMSGDRKMLAAFNKQEDIHARTAAEVLDVPLNKVTPEMRRKAKEVNFGILYGLGPRGLAQRTGTTYDEALAFIEKYFTVYSDLKEYLEETIALAHKMEYTETLFGRKRYLPEINAEHQGLRSQAERMATNHPLQGTAADLMKLAMIKVDKLIKEEFKAAEVKMILQVHDELVFEVKENKVKKATDLIQDTMESAHKLKVPIVVDVAVGNDWGECK